MSRLKEVEELRRKQQELRQQAVRLETDIEAVYKDNNLCPDCDGVGQQTIKVPKRTIPNWQEGIYKRLCSRCQGTGQFAEALPPMRDFMRMLDRDTTAGDHKGRKYWG